MNDLEKWWKEQEEKRFKEDLKLIKKDPHCLFGDGSEPIGRPFHNDDPCIIIKQIEDNKDE